MSQRKLPSIPPPSSKRRLARLRFLLVPFQRVGQWFRHQPRAIQIGLVVVLIAGMAVGGFYANSFRQKRGTAKGVAAAWGVYNASAAKGDIEGIRSGLERVLAIDPQEPTALRYLDMLNRGEADVEVPELAVVLLHQHLAKDKRYEAAREAEKVLVKNPKDWVARCAVAHYALESLRDRALAEKHLSQLPDPEDPAANVGASGLNYALKLSEAVGRDTSSLRKVIVRRLLPHLKREAATTAAPAVRLQLLECYLEPFNDPGSLGELAQYMAVADKLADSAITDAAKAGDVTTLVRLAMLWRPTRIALARLRQHDPDRLPEERYQALVKAIDERTKRAWQAVREKTPDRVEAYRGLAEIALSENNPSQAWQQILDGLSACGERSELLEMLLYVSRLGNDEIIQNSFRSVLAAAQTAKTDPAKWCLVADAAIALNRHDAALEACKQAREIQRDYPRACQIEAEVWIRAGDFTRARAALLPLGETALRINPGLAQLHARTLAESLWVLIDDEFKAVLDAQSKLKVKTSAPSLGFLLGVLDATPSREHAEWVAKKAAEVLNQDSSSHIAQRIRAFALYQLADLAVTSNPQDAAPVWNGDLVSVALRAFEELPQEDRTNSSVAAAIAALQLKGMGNAAKAMRTAETLQAAEESLNPWQLEVLGSVLYANDKYSDAVRVLERASKLPRPTTGLWSALALAYQKNRQPDDARVALANASNTANRSAREQAEYVFAKKLLSKEKP